MIAIQVCFELNEGNQEREMGGLAEAMHDLDIKQGIILTYNQDEMIPADEGSGIRVVPVWRWLLEPVDAKD
jgi:uncharacterized protein